MAAAESPHNAASPLVHALAGSFGSALALLLFYPLERARIELQSHATSKSHQAHQHHPRRNQQPKHKHDQNDDDDDYYYCDDENYTFQKDNMPPLSTPHPSPISSHLINSVDVQVDRVSSATTATTTTTHKWGGEAPTSSSSSSPPSHDNSTNDLHLSSSSWIPIPKHESTAPPPHRPSQGSTTTGSNKKLSKMKNDGTVATEESVFFPPRTTTTTTATSSHGHGRSWGMENTTKRHSPTTKSSSSTTSGEAAATAPPPLVEVSEYRWTGKVDDDDDAKDNKIVHHPPNPSAQQDTTFTSSSPSSSPTTTTPEKSKNVGLLQCLLRLHARGELYQGVTPVVSTIFTSQFVFFFMNAYVNRMFRHMPLFHKGTTTTTTTTTTNPHPQSSASIKAFLSLLASCIAGIGNVLLTNPLWVVNVAIITGDTKTSSLWKELVTMLQTHGWRHLWSGTESSILLVSNPVIQFFCYEQLKHARLQSKQQQQALLLQQQQHDQQRTFSSIRKWKSSSSSSSLNSAAAATAAVTAVATSLPPAEAFVAGALAKAVATVITYPLQLTQTIMRLEQQGGQYKGTMDCLLQLFQRGGISEWFTGMRAKMLQTVLTAAFTFLTYEQIVTALQMTLKRYNPPPPPHHHRQQQRR